VAASKSAARHEVENQAQRNLEAQVAAGRAADKQKREEEERDRRTQLAIDEAIQKERSRIELTEAQQDYSEATTAQTGRRDRTDNATPYSSYDSKDGERLGASTRYCPECGNVCKIEDKFCNRCGFKQPTADAEQRLGEDLRKNKA
jgi:hypothetical protein